MLSLCANVSILRSWAGCPVHFVIRKWDLWLLWLFTARSTGGAARRQRFNDLLPVKSPVLDEDLSRVASPNDYAAQMNSGHIALECIGIERGFPSRGIKCNA